VYAEKFVMPLSSSGVNSLIIRRAYMHVCVCVCVFVLHKSAALPHGRIKKVGFRMLARRIITELRPMHTHTHTHVQQKNGGLQTF